MSATTAPMPYMSVTMLLDALRASVSPVWPKIAIAMMITMTLACGGGEAAVAACEASERAAWRAVQCVSTAPSSKNRATKLPPWFVAMLWP
eukprot:363904-Chlamydomonas_euryale.AAC.10